MSQSMQWQGELGSSISICETQPAGVEDARVRAASAARIQETGIGRERRSPRDFRATSH
jgi:hypothetical protein